MVEEFRANTNLVNKQLAERSHMGTSWDPEKRAVQEIEGFGQYVNEVYDNLKKYAKTEKQKEFLNSEMERFQVGFSAKYNARLAAKGRTISSFITGPSNFPVRRAQKANVAEQNRYEEMIAYRDKAQAAILRELKKMSVEEAGGEIAVIKQKLADAERNHEFIVKANVIVRKKIPDDQKVKEIMALGNISEEKVREILKPDFMGRVGFAAYVLSNDTANIARMKDRIKELEKKEATPSGDIPFEGGTIHDSKEEDRIQIFFDKKPPQEIIDKLKKEGWRWSPHFGAWQRKRTDMALYSARRILGLEAKGPVFATSKSKPSIDEEVSARINKVIEIMKIYRDKGQTFEDLFAGLKGYYLQQSRYVMGSNLNVQLLTDDLKKSGYDNLRQLWYKIITLAPELRWVYGTKDEKWHLVGPDDRDYANGITQKRIIIIGPEAAKAEYLRSTLAQAPAKPALTAEEIMYIPNPETLTKEEFVTEKYKRFAQVLRQQGKNAIAERVEKGARDTERTVKYETSHRDQVVLALAQGKTVSANVLKDYPDIVERIRQEKKKTYRYYYRNRPPGIGTQPAGFIGTEEWLPIGLTPNKRSAFGWVEYDRPLSQDEIRAYELFEDEPTLPKLVSELVEFTKVEGIDEAMKEVDSEYGRAVWDWLKSQNRIRAGVGQKEQIRNEIMRLAGISPSVTAPSAPAPVTKPVIPAPVTKPVILPAPTAAKQIVPVPINIINIEDLEQMAWKMTSKEFINESLKLNKYQETIKKDPNRMRQYANTETQKWESLVEKHGEIGRLPDKVIEDYIQLFGEKALLRVFSGTKAKGIEGWSVGERSIKYRLPISKLKQFASIIQNKYKLNNIYLGGSQSPISHHFPNKYSDIDFTSYRWDYLEYVDYVHANPELAELYIECRPAHNCIAKEEINGYKIHLWVDPIYSSPFKPIEEQILLTGQAPEPNKPQPQLRVKPTITQAVPPVNVFNQTAQRIREAKTLDELQTIRNQINTLPLFANERVKLIELYNTRYSLLLEERPFGARVQAQPAKPVFLGGLTPKEQLKKAQQKLTAPQARRLTEFGIKERVPMYYAMQR